MWEAEPKHLEPLCLEALSALPLHGAQRGGGSCLTDVTCTRLRALNARGMQAANLSDCITVPARLDHLLVSVKGAAGRTSGGVLQYMMTGRKEKKRRSLLLSVTFFVCAYIAVLMLNLTEVACHCRPAGVPLPFAAAESGFNLLHVHFKGM